MIGPVVSVVVPARNAATWIGETLESVLAQTCDPDLLEIIVVDDGSTDATGSVVRDCLQRSGRRYEILVHELPQGPSAARNRGWRAAAGDWIQFLDADDLIEPAKIEQQRAFVMHETAPSLAAVFSAWGYLSDDGNGGWQRSGAVQPRIGDDPIRELLIAGNFVATGSLLFRRVWLERVGGYNESYSLVEDLELLMRIVMDGGRIAEVPAAAPTFWYRQVPKSLSRVNTDAFVRACLRNLKHAETHWRGSRDLTPARAAFLADEYFRLARYFAEHDQPLFDDLLTDIYELQPAFVPPRPASLRRAAQLVGYKRAEQIAIQYRKLKRLLQPGQEVR
jgi:glycosyltransferase involved in cell wall biosynthesis